MNTEVLEKPGQFALKRVTERRLTERVKNKWLRAARDRLPSLKEVETINFGPDKPFCFTVDLRLSDVFPYFLHMGEELTKYSTVYPMGDPRCSIRRWRKWTRLRLTGRRWSSARSSGSMTAAASRSGASCCPHRKMA